MSAYDILIVSGPFLALIAAMIIAFSIAHYTDVING